MKKVRITWAGFQKYVNDLINKGLQRKIYYLNSQNYYIYLYKNGKQNFIKYEVYYNNELVLFTTHFSKNLFSDKSLKIFFKEIYKISAGWVYVERIKGANNEANAN